MLFFVKHDKLNSFVVFGHLFRWNIPFDEVILGIHTGHVYLFSGKTIY